jgi:hypothetical protein
MQYKLLSLNALLFKIYCVVWMIFVWYSTKSVHERSLDGPLYNKVGICYTDWKFKMVAIAGQSIRKMFYKSISLDWQNPFKDEFEYSLDGPQ